MKNILLITTYFLTISFCVSQNKFPYNEKLQDTLGYNVPSVTFTNFGKPLGIEFFGTYCVPCIDLLNSFKVVYPDWQKKYGFKLIVVVTDVKSKRSKRKLMKLIKKHNWPFQFYLDADKDLFNKMGNSNVVPQTYIYDGEFNLFGKFLGVKPNYGYKLIDGKVSKEKVKIKNKGKYANLECDLTQYEDVLELLSKN